jgi:hypothetical protein
MLRDGPYGAPGQQARASGPIPWSDEPDLLRWARSERGGRSAARPADGWRRLLASGPDLRVLPIVLVGLLLFAIFFVIGYLMPLMIPLH